MFLTTSLNYNNVCTVEVSFDKLFLYYEHTVHYECDYPLLKYIYFCNWRVTVDKNGCMKHSRHMNGRCLSRVSLSFSLIVRTIRQLLQPITATTAASVTFTVLLIERAPGGRDQTGPMQFLSLY